MDALINVGQFLTATLVLAAIHFPLEIARSLLNFGVAPVARYARGQKTRKIAMEVAQTRERLAYLIDEGQVLLARLRDSERDTDACLSHKRAWTAQVEEFLSSDFGNAYVSRFQARPIVDLDGIAGVPPERLSDWKDLRDAVSNLKLFGTELQLA